MRIDRISNKFSFLSNQLFALSLLFPLPNFLQLGKDTVDDLVLLLQRLLKPFENLSEFIHFLLIFFHPRLHFVVFGTQGLELGLKFFEPQFSQHRLIYFFAVCFYF